MSALLQWPTPEDERAKATHFLHAGHLFASAEPTIVTTVLGSCVAVCLWDDSTGIGGLNHYLLPYRISEQSPSTRFGTLAIVQLIEKLETLGARRRGLRAKIFGGASMITPQTHRSPGRLNAEVALDLLRESRIPVDATDVGGTRGRKLIFHTDTGEVLLRML